MDNCSQEIRLLFETSWEVCNKIGGIYTVLSSKAKTLVNRFKDNVIFIGPDVWTDETQSCSANGQRILYCPKVSTSVSAVGTYPALLLQFW